MIDIIGVFQRVGQHKTRIEFAVDVGQPLHVMVGEPQRIVAGVEELDLGAKRGGGALGLVLAAGLHLLQRHAVLLPGKLQLAALAKGEADDLDAISLLRVQRDGASRTPDEIAGMGGDDETGFRHGVLPSF